MKMNMHAPVFNNTLLSGRALRRDEPFMIEAGSFGGVDCVVKGPGNVDEKTRICVAVHGIFRSPLQQVALLSKVTNKQNLVLVAPFFDKGKWRGYQQLKGSKKGSRADQALLRSLAHIRDVFSLPSRKIWMHGYSGGAQFVHRFAMLHPREVEAVVLGAAGWYTFPCFSTDYPLGLRIDPKKTPLEIIDPFGFLHIRYLVAVGSRDTVIDRALNQSPEIHSSQGRTRIERAQRWVSDMRSYIKGQQGAGRVELFIVDGVGHSFPQLALNPAYQNKLRNFLSFV